MYILRSSPIMTGSMRKYVYGTPPQQAGAQLDRACIAAVRYPAGTNEIASDAES